MHPPCPDPKAGTSKHGMGIDSAGSAANGATNGDYTALIGLLKQFTFTSQLQRMSVLCAHMRHGAGVESSSVGAPVLYVKGAPEKIASLCVPNSGARHF